MEYFIGLTPQNLSFFHLNEIFARYNNLKSTLNADDVRFKVTIEYYDKAVEFNLFDSVALLTALQ